MSNPRYTVILRGEYRFTLSRAQIEHDSPDNYFACCFLKDFTEAESRTVELDQDPALFALIIQHMSGYRIIPLSHNALPPAMTQEVAMENLVHDAKFFGLEGLYRLLTSPTLPPHIQWFDCDISGPIVDFEDIINGRLPANIAYTARGLSSEIDGVERQVLVYGRNMPLDIHWQWHEGMPSPDNPILTEGGFSNTSYLRITPSQARRLMEQHDAWAKTLSNFMHPDRIKADVPSYRDASIWIDGRKALLTDFSLWLEHIQYPPEERTRKPRYEEIRVFDESFPGTILPFGFEHEAPSGVLRLWADELFFVIRLKPISCDTPASLKLLDVKARTRGAIMHATFPPLSLGKTERFL